MVDSVRTFGKRSFRRDMGWKAFMFSKPMSMWGKAAVLEFTLEG